MSDITVIGLGAMGSAVANAFLNAGHATKVWNRSPERLVAYQNSAAVCAPDPVAAVTGSPVIAVCIDDYASTSRMFEEFGLGSHLRDRTLIQFSTGTPQEARDSKANAILHGTNYLDGALLAYPREIGQDGIVAISGDEEIYLAVQDLLGALSSDVRYLGAAIGGATALDLASLTFTMSTHLGLVHAALLCESEQVSYEQLAAVVVDSQPSDAVEITHLGQALHNNDFKNPSASINVYSGVMDRILSQATTAGIDTSIPEFASMLYKKGVAAGLGDEEVVALIKLLRR